MGRCVFLIKNENLKIKKQRIKTLFFDKHAGPSHRFEGASPAHTVLKTVSLETSTATAGHISLKNIMPAAAISVSVEKIILLG